MNKKIILTVSILLLCIFLNGCAILRLPFQTVGILGKMAYKTLGAVVKVAKTVANIPGVKEAAATRGVVIP